MKLKHPCNSCSGSSGLGIAGGVYCPSVVPLTMVVGRRVPCALCLQVRPAVVFTLSNTPLPMFSTDCWLLGAAGRCCIIFTALHSQLTHVDSQAHSVEHGTKCCIII